MAESLDEKLPYSEIRIDDHLSLRQVRLDEAGKLFALVDQNREHLREWLPWVDTTKSPHDSEEFITETIRKRIEGSEYGYGIVADGELVGHMSLMHITDGREPEIGYWIASKAAGQGLTTKAAEVLTGFGFDELGVNKITIKADPKNIGSNKVVENLGYTLARQEHTNGIGLANIWELEQL